MFKLIKIAYKFLRFDRSKSIGIMVAVVICSFLIGQNLGIFSALTYDMSSMVEQSQCDVWVTGSEVKSVSSLARLDKRKKTEVESITGVGFANAALITGGKAVFDNGVQVDMTLIGSEPPGFLGGPSRDNLSAGTLDDLVQDGAVTGEFYNNKYLGQNVSQGKWFELNGKRAHIVTITKGITAFSPIMYTTLERAAFYSNSPADEISAVLVKVSNGANVDSVVDRINGNVKNVKAWTKEKFLRSSINDGLTNTGIGASTTIPIIITIISGFFIIGLTIYSMALDRTRDYGILKAIGASNKFIRRLIFSQAALLAIAGFIISVPLLEVFRLSLASQGMIFTFSLPMMLGIFFTCITISLCGSLFALRRINGIEPASVFRN